MKLIFATNNKHKIEEITHAVGKKLELLTLSEAGIDIDIPEPHETLEENAFEKSRTIYDMTGINCFGEDTGLEVAALNGEPGVKSARYAGDDRSPEKNMEKLLKNLADKENKVAQFRTVISLILEGVEKRFEGVCKGKIVSTARGNSGFGYDPIFIPDGSDKTFAEMGLSEKDKYSHRAKAMAKLVAFLNNLDTKSKS